MEHRPEDFLEAMRANQPPHRTSILTTTGAEKTRYVPEVLTLKNQITMSIKFKAIARKSPVDKSVSYYPTTETPEVRSLNLITEEISQNCTLTRADIVACLAALQQVIINHLKDGRSVRLGDLGSFRLSMRGKGATTADDVKSDSIKSIRVLFTPSGTLQSTFKVGATDISFQRVASIYDTPAAEQQNAA